MHVMSLQYDWIEIALLVAGLWQTIGFTSACFWLDTSPHCVVIQNLLLRGMNDRACQWGFVPPLSNHVITLRLRQTSLHIYCWIKYNRGLSLLVIRCALHCGFGGTMIFWMKIMTIWRKCCCYIIRGYSKNVWFPHGLKISVYS